MVIKSAPEFSRNPREIKRFINMFRFILFLNAVKESRGEPCATHDQIRRWIVLSLKWPEVVRWIRRSFGGREEGTKEENFFHTIKKRITMLENAAEKSEDMYQWKENNIQWPTRS